MKLFGYTSNYNQFRSRFVLFIWYFVSLLIFENGWFPFYAIKIYILRLFGAQIGYGVIIKPKVYIKYPWLLEIGNHVWVGEEVRMDNLAKITIRSNVCISQRAYLLTGNHNYRSNGFDLMIGSITIEDEVWVGASSVVCPNSYLSFGTIVTVASVVSGKTDENCVYIGNPALNRKSRY
jgi:putative colanic acid biosynthesis acetyltransferase WcaF